MTQILESYREHIEKSNIPVLGMLAWFSVPKPAEIPYDDFISLIEQYEAPITKLRPPNAGNVFKRACSETKRNKQEGPRDDITCNYFVRDAGYTKEFVYKCLIEEMVDTDDHALDHRTIADIGFNKESLKVTFTPKIDSSDYAWPVYQEMKAQIENFVHEKAVVVHDYLIRESARKAVEHELRGVRVRPGGGVYFVSWERMAELEAVHSVINSI